MKLELSRQIFEKYLNIRFNENLPMGAQLFCMDRQTDRQTDLHDKANNSFSQFCECA
jgi:hypothetical protein